MEYIIYGILALAAVLFAGYLGSLRAVQLIADHEEEKHGQKIQYRPPDHVNCKSQLPPEYFNMPDGDVKSKEEIELMLQEAGKRPTIHRVPVNKEDLKERIRLLEDKLKGLRIDLQGQYDRLSKFTIHRLERIEKELEALEIKENVGENFREEYAEKAKNFYKEGENKNL